MSLMKFQFILSMLSTRPTDVSADASSQHAPPAPPEPRNAAMSRYMMREHPNESTSETGRPGMNPHRDLSRSTVR